MKRVKDFLKFEEFENKLKDTLLPQIKEIIEEAINRNEKEINSMRNAFKYFLISAGVTVLFVILTAILGFTVKNFSVTIAFLVISGIIAFATVLLFRLFAETRKKVLRSIDRLIDHNELYKIALEAIEPVALDKVSNETFLTSAEIQHFKPANVPDHARIFDRTPTVSVVLFDKFKAKLTNIGFEWYVNNGKERVRYQSWGFYLKIDTSPLGDKSFGFSFFSNFKEFKVAEKAKLENKDFNKVFSPWTSDQVKIRLFLTPLAMENMLNCYQYGRTNNIGLSNFSIVSLGDVIFYSMPSNSSFMVINFDAASFDVNQITKSIYSDIVYDIYGLYHLLSYLIIPSYLG